MHLKKRQLLKTLAAGLTVPYLPVSQAQAPYPNRAVSIIVPYPAGGGSDTVTRIIAQPLAAKLGQSAVVENVAGAGGLIGVPRRWLYAAARLVERIRSGAPEHAVVQRDQRRLHLIATERRA